MYRIPGAAKTHKSTQLGVPHLLHHALKIAGDLLVVVVRRHDRDVLPMIAKIEYQQVEFR